jgi:multidrug efflux pump subunit AcrB
MWIVRTALSRPYTFVALALLIVIAGAAAIATMPVDIFPYINIPIVSVVWSYNGMSADEMGNRIVTLYERALTTTVNDIEHIESQSYNGVGVVRIFFQPNVKIDLAIAQVTAISQTLLKLLPPGVTPPLIVKYDASSVPVLQLGLSSKTLSEQELYDLGNNFIRTGLATVPGASLPLPFGGRIRQVMVDLDPDALYAKQLSPADVSNALNSQNLILPAGALRSGPLEYQVRMNSSPNLLDQLNDLPIRNVNGATIQIRDVAQVRDGYAVQTNIVRTDGRRGALLTVLRNGQASTLGIVDGVKSALPRVLAGLPSSLRVKPLFDESVFVREAISGVVREAVIAALLTGLMILLFLGSWRSTLIVVVSIPLSILVSIIVLRALGHTINVMTLGGLALAVGVLVDDATVEIENAHRNLAMRKSLARAVLDGAHQIAAPTFVSTLSICIVFLPVVLLTGAARYLFSPLALAVVFAMASSYILSRSLVPTMIHHMLGPEVEIYAQGEHTPQPGFIGRVHYLFNRRFERLRGNYAGLLDWALDHRRIIIGAFALFVMGSFGLAPFVGRDFFPAVDSGQIRLHARAAAGTRIEETERLFAAIEGAIRRVIPSNELDTIIDDIGVPAGGVNLAFGDNPTIGGSDGEILISLGPRHAPTERYTEQLRRTLKENFPGVTFFFEPANMTNQILNFGLPAPIDVQVAGRDANKAYAIAQDLSARIARVPGATDVHIHQVVDVPELRVNVDRSKAGQLGVTQRDIAGSMLISLSSSGQISPNLWLNPANGVSYSVAVQTPLDRMASIDELFRTPVAAPGAPVSASTPDSLAGVANAGITSTGLRPNAASPAYGNPAAMAGRTQLLANVASFARGKTAQIVDHYNVQPVFDIYANTYRTDLGSVGSAVQKIVAGARKKLPKGMRIAVRGQVETMQTSFFRLGIGIVAAVVLVYLLMVVNFQSWLDPFIILMAIPGAFAGNIWALFLTGTTFSVPSLMGAVMSIGVATANSILMVVFANDERVAGMQARGAALSAGFTRIRPVMMTAAAMIIGMLPMALGLGEGAEQNAPLGRAVIGGLLVATATTLFVVPVVYSLLRKHPPVDRAQLLAAELLGDESADYLKS